MINFVLKKFIKKLNNASLSAEERVFMRKDFLARTGLPALAEQPSLKSSFKLMPSTDNVNFNLQLVEGCCGEPKNGAKIRALKRDVLLRVSLNVPDGDKSNFVVMKVSPQKSFFINNH